jgi:hypothetical protein
MNLESRIEKLELKIGGGKKPSAKQITEAAWRSFVHDEPFPYDEEAFPSEPMDEQIAEWIRFLLGGGTIKNAVDEAWQRLIGKEGEQS